LRHIGNVFMAICMALFVASCANPLNQATSDRYGDECSQAESSRRLDIAEQACYRALVNVDSGNLELDQKSQRLYNLARIKRQLAKFAEAEDLLKQSLVIEEKMSPPSNERIGRRLVELSVNLAAQDKWKEGVQYLDRVLPIAQQYSGQERTFLSLVFSNYGKEFRKNNLAELAVRYESASAALR